MEFAYFFYKKHQIIQIHRSYSPESLIKTLVKVMIKKGTSPYYYSFKLDKNSTKSLNSLLVKTVPIGGMAEGIFSLFFTANKK